MWRVQSMVKISDGEGVNVEKDLLLKLNWSPFNVLHKTWWDVLNSARYLWGRRQPRALLHLGPLTLKPQSMKKINHTPELSWKLDPSDKWHILFFFNQPKGSVFKKDWNTEQLSHFNYSIGMTDPVPVTLVLHDNTTLSLLV